MNDILINGLRSTREAVPELRADKAKADLFDEFLKEHEFDLALHLLCDFLLEQRTGAIEEDLLNRLQALHIQMESVDDCVEKLRRKT